MPRRKRSLPWSKTPKTGPQAIQAMLDSLGGKLEAYYVAVGNAGRVFTIFELPDHVDQVSIEAMMMATFSSGANTASSITPILTSAEMVEAAKKVPDIGFRLPSAQG
jgi:uncharacterized protein with GYD domain